MQPARAVLPAFCHRAERVASSARHRFDATFVSIVASIHGGR